MNNKDRFANILGEEYNIFKVSMPHYDDFQDQIGEIIKNYSASLRSDSISVVEGGSGTGLTTLRILSADTRIKVIGIDNEERTLYQARIILKEYGNRVDLRHEDLFKALQEMPDNFADIFASAWVIHNMPPQYRTRLFPEIARILKTGGLFVNGDKYAQDDQTAHARDLEKQIKAFDIFDDLKKPDLKREWTRHYEEDEKIKFTEHEQIRLLKNQQFSNITVSYRKVMDAIITAVK